MSNTIRRRLLSLLLPSLVALMLVGGAADYWIAAAATRNVYDQALASAAYAAAASLRVENARIRFDPTPQAATLLRINAADADESPLFSVRGPHRELIAGVPGLDDNTARSRAGTVEPAEAR
jgi:hypothetical protein